MTEIHRKRISESKKKQFKENPELRKRISDSKMGIPNPHKGEPWSLARRESQKFVKYKVGRKLCIRVRVKKPIKKGNLVYAPNWHELRKEIYTRDNWTCRECGKKCHNGVVIQCHHIDYNTNNNDTNNLITLCKGCHLKTNFKRKDWELYFKNRLSPIYGSNSN